MLNWLIQQDMNLFLFLNKLNHPSLDPVFEFISYNFIPGFVIICLFLFYTYKEIGKKFLLPFFFVLVCFGLADSISTRVFKNNIKRLRPMHEPQIKDSVHSGSRGRGGGKYGFVSSHASNTFAICMLIFLYMRKKHPRFKYIFIYAVIVSYSRIYLGKHYPLDLICGAILGIIIALFVYQISLKLKVKSCC